MYVHKLQLDNLTLQLIGYTNKHFPPSELLPSFYDCMHSLMTVIKHWRLHNLGRPGNEAKVYTL